MLALCGFIAKPWAITVGWVLQVLLALSAFFEPAILFVVLIFGGMWAYATIMGARIDAKAANNSAHNAEHTESD